MWKRVFTLVASVAITGVAAQALMIDQILLETNIQDPENIQFVDLTSKITNGQKVSFDMNTYFPTYFTQKNQGTGFIFIDENVSFGLLTKGLKVTATAPGQLVNAELDIFAHWDHAAGNIEQQIEVSGVLNTSLASPNAIAQVHYFDTLHPFLTDAPGQPVQGNVVSVAASAPNGVPISDGLGPATQFLPAGRIDYQDILAVGASLDAGVAAGIFATSDFINTDTESSTLTPEPSTILLLTVGGIGLLCYGVRSMLCRCRIPG